MYGRTETGSVVTSHSNSRVSSAADPLIVGPGVQQVGHIPEAVSECSRLLDMLTGEIAALEDRFQPVLRPAPVVHNGAETGKPAPSCSQLADALAALNLRIHAETLRLRALAARADI